MAESTQELLVRLRVEADEALRPLKKVETQTKATSNEFSNIGKNNKRFSSTLQNSSYQIADFAVQVGGGTSAMRAFSQQAPQLLAGFGAIGAAAGAVVAILAAGASSLFDFGDAAEEAKKQTDEMTAAIKGLISPSSGLGNLNKLLEESESRFAGLAGALKKAALTEAKNDLSDLEGEVSALVGSLTRLGEGNTLSRYLVLLSQDYSESEAAFKSLNEYIADLYDVSEEAAGSIQSLARQFSDGSIKAEDFAEAVLALGVDPKTDGYKELLALLNQIAEKAQAVKDLSKIDIELKVQGDDLQKAIDAWDDYIAGLERLASSYLDSLDPLRAYYREVKKLDELLAAGLINLKQYTDLLLQPIEVKVKKVNVKPAETVKPAEKELEGIKAILGEIQTESERWADQFASQLVDGLKEGKLAFKDFANYVLEQLARIALSKALEPLFNSFGSWIGGITGATAPTGLIAVPANDLPISREMSAAQPMVVGVPRMSAPSSSGSPVTVNVYNQGSNEVEVSERKTTRGIEVDVLIKNAVKKGIASGDFDKVMATSYGARRMAF